MSKAAQAKEGSFTALRGNSGLPSIGLKEAALLTPVGYDGVTVMILRLQTAPETEFRLAFEPLGHRWYAEVSLVQNETGFH